MLHLKIRGELFDRDSRAWRLQQFRRVSLFSSAREAGSGGKGRKMTYVSDIDTKTPDIRP